jgi:hypothetical protein
MNNNVNHPAHYNGFTNGSEVIDIAEHLTFNLGNVLRYVCRAGKKHPEKHIEDLEKLVVFAARNRKG